MAVKIQLRRGTAAEWSSVNPILSSGEQGLETDTKRIKIGDGTSTWNNLVYQDVTGEDLLSEAVFWIDSSYSGGGQTIRNLGTGGRQLDAQAGSTTGADSNDPKFLDWTGENYVYLSGVNGNYLSVPDGAALDITGDLDLRCYLTNDGSGNDGIIAKWATGQRSYQLEVKQSGPLALQWTTDGSTLIVATSTANYVGRFSPQWIRATLDVDNGAGAYEVKFYTSPDAATWTQLGTTITGGSTTSVFAGTSEVRIGAGFVGGTTMGGNLYRAQVLNGIDGTPVLDIDCSDIASGAATSFSARTGQTVTINRSTSGRKAVAVTHPCWLFGTDDYMEVADNDLIDFGASDSFTVLAVVRQWATAANFVRYVSKSDGSLGWEMMTSNTGANLLVELRDGTDIANAGATTFTSGALSALGFRVDRSSETLTTSNGTTLTSAVATSAINSMANALPLRVGTRSGTAVQYGAFEFIAAAIFRRALTSDEISTLTAYFQGRAI